MLLAHARQGAELALARQLLYAFEIANLVGAPDQGNGFRSQALHLQQLQHRRTILFQQSGVLRKAAVAKQLLKIGKHAFADAGNGQHLLGFGNQF